MPRRRFLRPVLCLLAGLALISAAGCSRKLARRGPPPYVREHREEYTLTHVVAEGETLTRIAVNYYGDASRVADIAGWNEIDGSLLAAGSALLLRFDPGEWQRAERRFAAMAPYNRGVDAFGQGRLDEALAAFDEALTLDPGFVDARYNRTLVLIRRGFYDRAESELTLLLAERPEDSDFLFARGNILFHQARFEEAAAAFAAILAGQPAHRQAAFSRARSLGEAGLRDEAAAAWRSYLALDADSRWADEARRQLRLLETGGDLP